MHFSYVTQEIDVADVVGGVHQPLRNEAHCCARRATIAKTTATNA